MGNSWVRLWLDMPTDPKFRTISKLSKQPLSAVIAVFVCMMTDAANATERGRTSINDEDLASTLDLEIEQVAAIRDAMQGRLLDGYLLTGWKNRQPPSDSSAARPSSEVWRLIRLRIFQRDDYTCQYCGIRGSRLECDHVHPVALGGGHEDSNLVTACFRCNRSKRSKTLDQWRRT